ncbi:hypothetical protein Mgra_00005809 [Meloidogyne graminicola]|uniref:Uncharacterized protein n=1 Tax=Meloidogyne graminicola TaxID=189291 RepID=A0A8S9ZNW9_9BILA|nr:hypothetical protein Mgra_00005809 [Meloidogyne graminicola]
MFFPLISSSNNKNNYNNSTYLKPGKFPVNNQQDINENLIDFSNFSSSIGALDLKQKKQQRSRSQPEDFIETDCCCNEKNNKNNNEEKIRK